MQTKKIKIGCSFLSFPVTMARYFVEAIEDRDDCEVYDVGPHYGDYIPWGGGMRISPRYVRTPYLPLPQQAQQQKIPYQMIRNRMPDDLDLFLCIDAGWHFSTRPNAKVVALIKTDPHAIPEGHYAEVASYCDIVFNMQTPYIKPGEVYLPYAYSKRHHYDEELTQLYDACLIGLHYKQRDDLVDALRKKNYSVYYSIGEVFDEFRTIYNHSRIALSWSSQQDLCARNWEALAMHRLLIANRVPDMGTFFVDGEHYLGFDTLDEAVSQVDWAMNNPIEAENIADAGWRKVQPHTYDSRVEQILETCKLL